MARELGGRRCVVLRGTPDETLRAAASFVAQCTAREDADPAVLFVGDRAPHGARLASATETKKLLGHAFDAVVIDLHRGLDADVIARAHGFVWGGGALVLRMNPRGAPASPPPSFVVHPFEPRDVGARFAARLERVLDAHGCGPPSAPLDPPDRATAGTAEQAALVSRLRAAFAGARPTLHAILADRGRGKSSALGLAAADLPLRIALSASEISATAEGLAFAAHSVELVPLAQLSRETARFDVILIDEAAQISVPQLRAVVRQHPATTFAFSTTARGYEGTGRGFVLRFLEELAHDPRPLTTHTLHAPIRWSADDPLERLTFDLLALDFEPARIEAPALEASLEHVAFDRDRLLDDEPTLCAIFGLLVHAHYRTTPSDLHRLLDAPNLVVHALRAEGQVLAASLVALEGELPDHVIDALYSGKHRVRGHALPETLICHAHRPDAGRLSFVRSSRIATHPRARRRGLASTLVRAIHAHHRPDAFGTLFGASPELIHFRRRLGYEVVRLGSARGARSGEPTVVMMHPVSERAQRLVLDLREDLARDLDTQLTLQYADDGLERSEALERALRERLAPAAPRSPAAIRAMVERYARGAVTYASVADAVHHFVAANASALTEISEAHAALLRGRAIEQRSWQAITPSASSVPATMRAMRRAVSSLLARVEGHRNPG